MPVARTKRRKPMEVVELTVADLVPHPRNYRTHPPDQLEHLKRSITEHGFYRNVVVARDGRTILAGHGVVQAATEMGLPRVPGYRVSAAADSPAALRIVAGDNEIARLAEVDDRALTELLRDVQAAAGEVGLSGTGYDEMMLANLLLVTRTEEEIPTVDAAREWAGLPAFEASEKPIQAVVSFKSAQDRERFMELVGVTTIYKRTRGTWSFWWPNREYDQPAAEEFRAT